MEKQALRSNPAVLVYLCILSLCALTFPKVGKTNAVNASANAYAYKSGQNWIYSTFKGEAYAGASAPDGSVGVYELKAELTGKTTAWTRQVPFSLQFT